MAVGLKDKVAELVAEQDQGKREELGREIILLCQEMHKLIEENHAIVAKMQKLEEGFFN